MPYLQRRCGSSDPSHPPTRQAITAWLSGLASFEEDVAANLCREEGPSFSDCLRQAEAACAVDVSQEQGSAGKTLCGVEAVAQLLHLTCREPVNLEPSPVPMLLAAGAEDPLLSKEEVNQGSSEVAATVHCTVLLSLVTLPAVQSVPITSHQPSALPSSPSAPPLFLPGSRNCGFA